MKAVAALWSPSLKAYAPFEGEAVKKPHGPGWVFYVHECLGIGSAEHLELPGGPFAEFFSSEVAAYEAKWAAKVGLPAFSSLR